MLNKIFPVIEFGFNKCYVAKYKSQNFPVSHADNFFFAGILELQSPYVSEPTPRKPYLKPCLINLPHTRIYLMHYSLFGSRFLYIWPSTYGITPSTRRSIRGAAPSIDIHLQRFSVPFPTYVLFRRGIDERNGAAENGVFYFYVRAVGSAVISARIGALFAKYFQFLNGTAVCISRSNSIWVGKFPGSAKFARCNEGIKLEKLCWVKEFSFSVSF